MRALKLPSYEGYGPELNHGCRSSHDRGTKAASFGPKSYFWLSYLHKLSNRRFMKGIRTKYLPTYAGEISGKYVN